MYTREGCLDYVALKAIELLVKEARILIVNMMIVFLPMHVVQLLKQLPGLKHHDDVASPCRLSDLLELPAAE